MPPKKRAQSQRRSSNDTTDLSSDDLRIHYANKPFYERGTRQGLLGSEYIIVEPNNKIEHIPSQVDFNLPSKGSIVFGPMSKFRIKGVFQKQEENSADWTNLSASEAEQILLAPNWLDMLIKEISVFHNNNRITSSNENRFIVPFINSYLYHNMDPLAKKLLCPQPSHPGYCVPDPDGKWTKDAAVWTKYAKAAFVSGAISFDYTPLFLFPFYQGGSYLIDDNVPRILPAPAVGQIQIRFSFTDSQDHIFRKAAADTNKAKYRFAFTEFNLVLEEARLAAPMEKQLRDIKRPIAFPGVTRMQLVENVPVGSSSCKARFQNIYLPEGIFIFCLNKAVANGTYKFAQETESTVFAAHNLESVDIAFDSKKLSIQEPHIGTIRRDELDFKLMYDHLVTPPFGVEQDPKFITAAYVANGSEGTAFPHIYVSLVAGPNGERLLPWMSRAEESASKRADLDIELIFTEKNAPSNTIFIIYVVYSDVSIVYDPMKKNFSSPYLQFMN